MSVSGGSASSVRRKGVAWAYELSKEQLLKYLEDNNISYNKNAKFEELRKQVVEIEKELKREKRIKIFKKCRRKRKVKVKTLQQSKK